MGRHLSVSDNRLSQATQRSCRISCLGNFQDLKALIEMAFFDNWPTFEKQPDARCLLPQVPSNLKGAKVLRHWNDFGRKHAYNIYSWNIQLEAFLRHIWTPIVLLFFSYSEFSCHGNICLRGSLQWYPLSIHKKQLLPFFKGLYIYPLWNIFNTFVVLN